MKQLTIIKPEIFSKFNIISGVTGKNSELFPPNGLSFSNADLWSDEEIEENKRKFASLLGIAPNAMKYQQQTHSDIIREITRHSEYEASDGMYTSEKGIVLNIKIADCTAVLIFDPVREVIMGLHSGWRGTRRNITAKGINTLMEKFGSDPKEILAFLSPAACGKCYEVGREFADFFPRSTTLLSTGKALFDNRREIAFQLMDAGILEKNIEISQYCTIESSIFHSYRQDGHFSGRMSAFIGMK